MDNTNTNTPAKEYDIPETSNIATTEATENVAPKGGNGKFIFFKRSASQFGYLFWFF